MRFTPRDILAEASTGTARGNISETAETKGRLLSVRFWGVVGKANIRSVFDLSFIHPIAILQFGIVRGLCRYVTPHLFFFPLYHQIVQGSINHTLTIQWHTNINTPSPICFEWRGASRALGKVSKQNNTRPRWTLFLF